MIRLRITLACFVVFAALLGAREWTLKPDGHLHIRFLNVGQGDSTLITTPSGRTIVIDGGPDWSTLEGLGTYMPFFDRHLDLLMLSHPNLDHLLSFPEILKRYSVGALAMTEVPDHLAQYEEMFALAKEKNIPILKMFASRTIDLGDGAMLTILWPPETMPKGFTKELNDTSVVARLEYAGHRALFTGDLERPAEETLVRAHADLKADILKVGHHGSKTSTSTGFLLAVHPSLAVISVGKDNTFGHPNRGIIDRLIKAGATVRRTDEGGTVEITW